MEFSTTTLSLIAITFVVVLTGVSLIGTFGIIQDADARGCVIDSIGFNASKGRCFQPKS